MIIKKSQTKIEKFGSGVVHDYPLPLSAQAGDDKLAFFHRIIGGLVKQK